MLRKILFAAFCLVIIPFMLIVGIYFLQQGNEWTRFSDEPSKIVEAYAAKPIHFEAASAKSAKWYRGNIAFMTEDNHPVLLENYTVDIAERDILMQGGKIKLQYLLADPQITKKLRNNDGVFWAYAVAVLCFICCLVACWSLFTVFNKKHL